MENGFPGISFSDGGGEVFGCEPGVWFIATSHGVPNVFAYRLWIAAETGVNAPDPGVPLPVRRFRLNASANRRITPFARKQVISHNT